MDLSQALPAQALCHRCDPADVPFDSTAGAPAVEEFAGQERAARALDFAMGVAGDGYNAFVMGPEGIGRHSLVAATLARHAAAAPAPSDWVYVNNFASASRPIAIELPAGRGAALRDDMKWLVAELRTAIPAILEGEEYAQRVEKIDREIAERRDEAVRRIGASAQAQGIALLRTPVGYGFAPARDNEILDAEAFEKLPEAERARINAAMAALQEQLEHAVREAIRGRKERAERLRELDRETVMLALEPLVAELARRYAAFPRVVDYLHAVRDDVLQNADTFRGGAEGAGGGLPAAPFARELARYAVNLLVDRGGTAAPRVEYCDHPTYANLVGRLEHVQHLGTLVTDFTLLKAGALHRANGGYLVLDALKLLSQPFAWEALKRALARREVRIETASELWGIASTVSLEAEPIALGVKVVLIGERRLYYLLQALDPDFARLFKVVADFEEVLERDGAGLASLAHAVATLARKAGLLPLDRGAVARALDEAVRRAGDTRKVSADVAALGRLVQEADFLAREAKRAVISAPDIDAAAEAQRARAGRVERRVQEAIARGTLVIETSGSRIGQVNGLAVIDLGEFPFAAPARITATTRPGDGQVIDVQRESQLGGAIHSKAVLILAQFLAARFSGRQPHSLAASLVFEQTYHAIEGDSASLAELCALLSSLAEVPLRQSFAVTGSVDQRGRVQAVGGINEKIEGFFDVCSARGLDGTHGVVIPAANVEHLMLRERVVQAAAQGLFRVVPVSTVDEAVELLSGMPAGRADDTGAAAARTVNGRAARRMRSLARSREAPQPVILRKPRVRER